MAMNDQGELQMTRERAREAAIRRVQQATMQRTPRPVTSPAVAAAGAQAQGIGANLIPSAPATEMQTRAITQPAAPPAVQQAGAAARGIASGIPAGPASDIRSQAPVGAPRPAAAPAVTAAPAANQAPGIGGRVRDAVSAAGSIRNGQAVATLARGAARAAPYAGAALATADLVRTAADPNSTGLDVAGKAANTGGAVAGAAAGGAIAGPLGAVGGGVIGGAGSSINDGIQKFFPKAADAIGGTIDSVVRRFGGPGYDPVTVDPTAPVQTRSAARPAASPAPSTPGQASVAAPAQQDSDPVVGSFNGKPIRQSDVTSAGSRVSVIPSTPARAPDPGQQAQSIISGLNARRDAEDSNFAQVTQSFRRDRLDVQKAAEGRLSKLYGDLDTALFRGNRRSAAILQNAIAAELGLVGQGIAGQAPDPRRQTQTIDPNAAAQGGLLAAQAGEAQAKAGTERQNTQRQQRINELMQQFSEDPTGEQGQRARSILAGLGVGNAQQQAPYRFSTVEGAPGEPQRLIRTNQVTGAAEPVNIAGAASSPIIGQAKGPDGKLYNIRADGTPELAE